jgi:hypothetical protein
MVVRVLWLKLPPVLPTVQIYWRDTRHLLFCSELMPTGQFISGVCCSSAALICHACLPGLFMRRPVYHPRWAGAIAWPIKWWELEDVGPGHDDQDGQMWFHCPMCRADWPYAKTYSFRGANHLMRQHWPVGYDGEAVIYMKTTPPDSTWWLHGWSGARKTHFQKTDNFFVTVVL